MKSRDQAWGYIEIIHTSQFAKLRPTQSIRALIVEACIRVSVTVHVYIEASSLSPNKQVLVMAQSLDTMQSWELELEHTVGPQLAQVVGGEWDHHLPRHLHNTLWDIRTFEYSITRLLEGYCNWNRLNGGWRRRRGCLDHRTIERGVAEGPGVPKCVRGIYIS